MIDSPAPRHIVDTLHVAKPLVQEQTPYTTHPLTLPLHCSNDGSLTYAMLRQPLRCLTDTCAFSG